MKNFIGIPRPINRLAPTRPSQRDMSNDAWRSTFTRQAITRLPDEVTQQNIRLKMFVKGLPFKKCIRKGVAQGANRIAKDMVQHVVTTLTMCQTKCSWVSSMLSEKTVWRH